MKNTLLRLSSKQTSKWKRKRIAECSIALNGMVMAFDEDGNQIPKCQGFILQKRRKLLKYCDAATVWSFTDMRTWAEKAYFQWWWAEQRHRWRYRARTWIKWRCRACWSAVKYRVWYPIMRSLGRK